MLRTYTQKNHYYFIQMSEQKNDLVHSRMLSITNEFLKDPISVYFTQPISQDDDFAAEYFAQIKHPMDLKTLKRNIIENKYNSITEWARDFNLIFDNAITFNGEGNLISGAAHYLQKKFSKKYRELLSQNSQVFETKIIELRNKLAVLLNNPPVNSGMRPTTQVLDIPAAPFTKDRIILLMNRLNKVTNEKTIAKIRETLEIDKSEDPKTINLSRLGRGKLAALEAVLIKNESA